MAGQLARPEVRSTALVLNEVGFKHMFGLGLEIVVGWVSNQWWVGFKLMVGWV